MKIVIRRLYKFDDEDVNLIIEEGFRVLIDDKIILEKWEDWFVETGEILQTVLETIGHAVEWESDYTDDEYDYDDHPEDFPRSDDPDDLPGHR